MAAVNECFAELACYMPIASPNIRLGASWVDSAFGFAMVSSPECGRLDRS